jgi:hypothetical protein
MPDLIKEGLIKQDLTTYKQLIARHIDPIVVFLTKPFAFNMQRSILGICTVSKKKKKNMFTIRKVMKTSTAQRK